VCTLACCKPQIRKCAKLGDYILGTGAALPKLTGHLTYWMRVDEIFTFDSYWVAWRLRRKKPTVNGTTFLRYGDNINNRHGGDAYKQEDSCHSREDGTVSLGDLHRDTGTTDKVLVAHEFAFFGRQGIEIPAELDFVVKRGPGHRCRFKDEQVADVMAWLQMLPQRGYIDEPAHWQFLDAPRSSKSQKNAA
jgi:hypothetical protein